jgi:hypothetical protein
MSDIAEAIRKIVNGTKIHDKAIIGTVNKVSGVFCDITPEDGTADLKGIRLCAEDSSTVFIVVPKIGSKVYVSLETETEGIVTGFSEVDSIQLRGDAHNGLVKVAELVNRLNLIESNFNAFVAAFNALVTVYSAHFHIPGGPPPLTQGVPFTTVLVPTQQIMIENTKVKHG